MRRRHSNGWPPVLSRCPRSRPPAGRRPIRRSPVRLVVGFAAGQAIDILARLIAQSLSEQLGQQFVVENRPGAGGNIAAEAVAHAPADGYTLLVIGANNPINTTLYPKLGFDLLRDFAPVAGIYRVYQVMVVIRRSRHRPSPSSSPTPRRIRARSTSARPAPARSRM